MAELGQMEKCQCILALVRLLEEMRHTVEEMRHTVPSVLAQCLVALYCITSCCILNNDI